eukprot:TRINITY_DN112791_c0_g1_i1.p1 TRINITY_DN112791_c0_g1~~TRINITY_DN112791_c0_g1_i1.p1  ORF type:complete len:192 (-),score=4.82 TRINITY_DN112791_c0_g1_i1:195-770(-)
MELYARDILVKAKHLSALATARAPFLNAKAALEIRQFKVRRQIEALEDGKWSHLISTVTHLPRRGERKKVELVPIYMPHGHCPHKRYTAKCTEQHEGWAGRDTYSGETNCFDCGWQLNTWSLDDHTNYLSVSHNWKWLKSHRLFSPLTQEGLKWATVHCVDDGSVADIRGDKLFRWRKGLWEQVDLAKHKA